MQLELRDRLRLNPAFIAATALVLCWILTGCAGSTRRLPLYTSTNSIPVAQPASRTNLQIQYLGGSGFLLRHGTNAIMTAPFYSNPSFLRTGLCTIASKTNLVDELLPNVSDVQAILVGHSHYDHLMDVPFIANHRAPQAKIYGNVTMTNLLAGAVQPARLNALEFSAGDLWDGGRPGTWYPSADSPVRFMALRSEHAPHLHTIKLFCGEVAAPQSKVPTRSWEWKEGQTLAFIIDFQTGTNIDFRVFYHDSAVNCPRFGGLPNFTPEDDHQIDIDILCMASFAQVTNYPEYIVRSHQPRNVVIGHWEDFFRSPKKQPKVVRFTNAEQFIEILSGQCGFPTNRTFLPVPGAIMHFSPD